MRSPCRFARGYPQCTSAAVLKTVIDVFVVHRPTPQGEATQLCSPNNRALAIRVVRRNMAVSQRSDQNAVPIREFLENWRVAEVVVGTYHLRAIFRLRTNPHDIF